MTNNYYQKHKESFQKKHVKDIKIFLKKQKKNMRKKAPERYQNLTEEKKETKISIIVNLMRIFLRNRSRS